MRTVLRAKHQHGLGWIVVEQREANVAHGQRVGALKGREALGGDGEVGGLAVRVDVVARGGLLVREAALCRGASNAAVSRGGTQDLHAASQATLGIRMARSTHRKGRIEVSSSKLPTASTRAAANERHHHQHRERARVSGERPRTRRLPRIQWQRGSVQRQSTLASNDGVEVLGRDLRRATKGRRWQQRACQSRDMA